MSHSLCPLSVTTSHSWCGLIRYFYKNHLNVLNKSSLLNIWCRYQIEYNLFELLFIPLTGSALAANVCKKITGRLTSAIAKQEDVSVQLEALDIMADMLSR